MSGSCLEHLNPAARTESDALASGRAGWRRSTGSTPRPRRDRGRAAHRGSSTPTLRIDGVEQRCTVVWRQIVPVSRRRRPRGRADRGRRRGRRRGRSRGPTCASGGPRACSRERHPRRAPARPARDRAPDRGRARRSAWPGAAIGTGIRAHHPPLADDVEIIDPRIRRPSPLQIGRALRRAGPRRRCARRRCRLRPAAPAIGEAEPAPNQRDRGSMPSSSSNARSCRARKRCAPAVGPRSPFFFDPRPAPRLELRAPIVGAPWSGALASPAHPARPSGSRPSRWRTLRVPAPAEVLPLARRVIVLPPPRPRASSSREPERPAASRFFHVLRREDESRLRGSLPPLGDGEEVSLEAVRDRRGGSSPRSRSPAPTCSRRTACRRRAGQEAERRWQGSR